MLANSSKEVSRRRRAQTVAPIDVHLSTTDSKVDVAPAKSKRPKLVRSLSEAVIEKAKAKFEIDPQDNIIADRVSRIDVLKFFENRRVGFRYTFIPEKTDLPDSETYGQLIILELTKPIHAAVAGDINNFIVASVGDPRLVTSFGSSDSIIGGVVKNPDGGVYPKGLRPDNVHVLAATSDRQAFPNVVWEVAYLNEDEDTLIQELLLWISPYSSVQVAIGVKIHDLRSVDNTVRMTAYMFRKQQTNQPNPPILEPYHKGGILIPQFPPEVRIEFGTNIPAATVATLSLSFPESDYHFGTTSLSPPNWTIDIPLLDVQTTILDKLPDLQ
jgi:hypothetical protein